MTPLPPHNGHLFTTANFFCPQGNRYEEVRLYYESSLGTIASYRSSLPGGFSYYPDWRVHQFNNKLSTAF